MCPQRRGGWRRGWQRWGTLSSSYWHRSAVGGKRVYMILHDLPNQGDGVLCCWWGFTLLVVAHYIGGRGEAKREVGANF